MPSTFRASIALLVLLAPLAGLEVALYLKAPYWNLPLREMGTATALTLVALMMLGVGLAAGRRWAFGVASAALSIWLVVTFGLALKAKSSGLGFFAAFQALMSGAALAWIRQEMGRSFLDPRLKWYQGSPRPVPQLYCGISERETKAHFRVTRMNEEGAFLFADDREPGAGDVLERCRKEPVELVFDFRNRELRCKGRMARAVPDRMGAGFRFVELGADARKEVGDFVENLRGEGYVE